ncbi:glycoside hydrolase family protein [Sunxiuqinia sp. sy24]|uniref:glycoside hydrolase family protein n=1 Tax=Sunxiuqinia sp. sy24 TaxID=3461495 RepID=UPI00404641AB
MNMNLLGRYLSYRLLLVAFSFLAQLQAIAQDIERQRPEEWNNLIIGGRFMDRFQPIPPIGKLTSDTWGADAVRPRYTDNGIEDPEWSYWGGNIRKGDDGNYHLMVCRWPESAEKGHMEWPRSEVVHAVSDNPQGPFKVQGETIGKGHNPEFFRLKDGRYVIYVISAHYIADELDGPWTKKAFTFDPRDRKINDGLSNVSFAQREDGSFLAVCRGGGIWISETGISPYYQVSNKSVYPPYDGRYEDPVIWRTNIQYHMIVNDWYGRIAYYLRSKDGVDWKVEPGEAYMPGIANYEDGILVDWYKFERIKMLQDDYGRAYQANFAVIDSSKWADMGNDHHSSKNICLPLTKGSLLTILDKNEITAGTKKIRVKIEAETGFNPHTDIDLESIRFGASEEVNFGRGSQLVNTKKDGKDLILIFSGKGNGLADENFVAKLLGKTKQGKLLFGYARLPWLVYEEPILSARKPMVVEKDGKTTVRFEVSNFGQVASQATTVVVEVLQDDETMTLEASVPLLAPYAKTMVELTTLGILKEESILTIKTEQQAMPLFAQQKQAK